MGRFILAALHGLVSALKHRAKHFRASLILGLWIALTIRANAADVQLKVENSGSKVVDALVVQLVSDRPAPFPSGFSGNEIIFVTPIPYMTLQVSNALAELKKMGPPIFPALVKHLRDDRYSYSDISAAWDNWTVGDSIVEVLSDGHDGYSGYKWRDTPSGAGGGYLQFNDYLKSKKPEKWAEWAKDKTRLEIQLDFIDWCVDKEKERGFVDEAQKKRLMDTYERARAEVRKEYSDHKDVAAPSQN